MVDGQMNRRTHGKIEGAGGVGGDRDSAVQMHGNG